MKKIVLTLYSLLAGIWLYGQGPNNTVAINEAGNIAQAQHYMQSQKGGFEENKGQVTGQDAARVKYSYKAKGLSVFLLNNGIAYQFSKTHYPEGYKHLDKFAKSEEREKMEELAKQIRTETYRMDVQLVGANPNLTISTEGKSQDYTQYYNHNALEVHSYSKITYHNVYPNIDWVIYTKGEQGLKYDFVVHPGGNPNQIKLQTNWVENLKLNQDGSLTLQNRMGSITEQTPVSFQEGEVLKTSFQVENNLICFNVANYNPTKTLIIDPNLLWATYYGGSSFEGFTGIEDYGSCNVVCGSGNVYLAGSTGSTNAISFGGYQNTYGGGNVDAFLVKFNSAGVRQWATYYGGNTDDDGRSCAIDGSGNVYLAGQTRTTTGIVSGGHQNTIGGGYDAFLVKFNSSGIRQWATYYGGNTDDDGLSCAIDGSGNVYLAGQTQSTTGIVSGGHQNTIGGGYDAFLVKFTSAGVRQWATYYGGNGNDVGYSCAVDGSGNVYLAGSTGSTNAIAAGGHQNTYGGAFLVKFNATGIRLWATYYAGSGNDGAHSCAVDGSGNVYLAGSTAGATSIAAGGHQNTFGGNAFIDTDAFLVKFNSAGVRQWATYYGGSAFDWGFSCVTDGTGNVYLAGFTESTTAIAFGGYQNTYGGYTDAFLVKFNNIGIRQWGTYYGGSAYSLGYSCAVDSSGNVYLAGYTSSSNAIASGGHQNTYGGGNADAFLAKLGDLPICVPSSFSFNDTVCQGSAYLFNGINRTITGTYKDTLQNAAGCDSIITLNLTIKQATSNIQTVSACGSYLFNNQTITQSGTYKDTLQNAAGCDSIITLNLTIKQATSNIQTVSACGSYLFNNQTITQSGTYKDTLQNAAGCDSIVTLNLTIKKATSSTKTVSACGSYLFNNQTITQSGTYKDTLPNTAGCDSISP